MPPAVQATCPGCKQRLHIPAERVGQAVRCENCGLMLTARKPTSPTRTPSSTPPPLPREQSKRAPTPPPVHRDTFADLDGGDEVTLADGPPPLRRPRRQAPTAPPWVAALVVIFGAAIALGGAYLGWKYMGPGDPDRPRVENDKDDKKDGKKDDKPSVKDDREPPRTPTVFPRRALVVSVNNYLYANPVQAGPSGNDARTVANLVPKLVSGLKIPPAQVVHLGESARENPRPAIKPVIEETLARFLDTCRAQDRVLVVFVGHAVEVEGAVYLVPMEGEPEDTKTLIPLQSVYDKLAACKARQKVLVADVCRFSPTVGSVRPGGEPMAAKIDEALKSPPRGVQVWSSCAAGQRSWETDNEPGGAFVDALYGVLDKGIQGKIQKADESLPLAALRDGVNQNLKEFLDPFKLEQQSRLAGEEADGTAYDPKEGPPPPPVLAAVPVGGPENAKIAQEVFDEVNLPNVKPGREDTRIKLDSLPPFAADLRDYARPEGEKTPLREKLHEAQVLLWAVSTSEPPPALKQEVTARRGTLRFTLDILRDEVRAAKGQNAENALKATLLKNGENVARLLGALDEVRDELKKMEDAGDLDKEPKRWQANYAFLLARLEMQIAYLFEYQSALGSMRKEFPSLAEGQNGWRLASRETMQGDSVGKRLARNAQKSLEKLADTHKDTPWAVLAKREKRTTLGLEWQGTK